MKKRPIPLNRAPILGNVLKALDTKIGEVGVPEALRNFLQKTNSKLEVIGLSEKTKILLRDSAVLLVANHEHDVEGAAVPAGLPTREDIYVVGAVAVGKIGPNFAKHIIPVHIRPSSISRKEMKFFSKTGRRMGLETVIPSEEAHKLNIQSIDTASKHLENGHMVIIFPQGARKESKWSPGVGHLVTNISRDCEVYIIRAHVQGTSEFDFLRLVPGIQRLMPTLKVTFSKPNKISAYLSENIKPKELAKKLQDEYNAWVTSITPP